MNPDLPLRPQPRKIKSAERTLALFELFSREQRPFTVTMIADALQIPQPSVSMLLQNLDALGYLEYDRQARTYSPSIRVALLGSWINIRFKARHVTTCGSRDGLFGHPERCRGAICRHPAP